MAFRLRHRESKRRLPCSRVSKTCRPRLPEHLAGRIAVLNQPINVAQGEEGYRAAARGRRDGPSVAAARGAVGFLVRSLIDKRLAPAAYGCDSLRGRRSTHSRGCSRRTGRRAPGPPGGARTAGDSAHESGVHRHAKTPAWNVVGDLVGRDGSGEMIVIGGHLDSWDVAEGATDDAAGIAICLAATHLIAELPQRPRRTIRVVLWGSEETGGSGTAFARAHRDEISRIVLASESDMGSGSIYRIAFSADAWNDPRLSELAAILAPLGILPNHEAATFAGTDVEDLRKAGVPIVRMSQDARRYFATHHSADDTLNKVDRSDLEQNVAAWAAMLYVIAESGIDLRGNAPAKRVDLIRRRRKPASSPRCFLAVRRPPKRMDRQTPCVERNGRCRFPQSRSI